MLKSLAAALKLPDVRRRILFVFGMIGVYVLGAFIALPNVDHEALDKLFSQGGGLFGLLDAFVGGSLRRFSIFALGIMPYINASIIFQLLAMAVPQIEQWTKEGEYGRKKISKYTRWLTVILAAVQAAGLIAYLSSMGVMQESSLIQSIRIIIVLSAGTAFLMWMGELITDKGVGNGVSVVIFAGIMTSFPGQIAQTIQWYKEGLFSLVSILGLVLILLLTITAIVAMQLGQRRIPVQYAKQVHGRRYRPKHSTYLPLRVNAAGVMPIIFAISVLMFPAQVLQLLPYDRLADLPFIHASAEVLRSWGTRAASFFSPGQSMSALIMYFVLTVLFTYFYTAVTFKPTEVADQLKKNGGYVPGVRPGKPTINYLDRVMTRITLVGALFLGIIALLPYLVPEITGVTTFSLVGGTSLLIVVGVALDTMQQIETHLLVRQYEGFIK